MGAVLRGLAMLAVGLGPCLARAGEGVTTESLLREMVDLSQLAEFPDPAFKTVQFSSYDRRSQVPGGPGWFSNADGFGGEPIPAFEAVLKGPGSDGIGEYLVCDIRGPGAIVRVWTAAINGTIRMELDDAPEPVFDGSADDFLRRPFNVLGERVGVDPSVFEGSFNQQNASYCPIAFAKHCRIVWTGNLQDVHFYEVQVRLYESDAKVRTFAPDDLRDSFELVRSTAEALRAPGAHLGPPEGALESKIEAMIAPGEGQDLAIADGEPGAIVGLSLRVEAADLDRALRQTVLHIFFDGAPHAQVESPLGDFFGAAPGINPFDSVPFTVDLDGTMTCRFVMPYAESMRIHAENLGRRPVVVVGSVLLAPRAWDGERSMHFRAHWRVDHGLTGDPAAPQDIPFLVAQGQGRYVGTASIMLNPTDVPTPGGGWWGEGDEKIFVDGDVSPSTYGTGSEDYYDYAWSIPDIFGFAYCGQPRNDGPGNRGFVTNHRWHILDSLPFRQRLAFYMELWTHRHVPGFSYARIGYHYARPGLIDDHLPVTAENVRALSLPANWRPLAEGGARNSVFIEAEDALQTGRGDRGLDTITDNLFSGGRLLRWSPTERGEEIALRFTIEKPGTYAADLCAMMSGDSGPVRIWIDDRSGDEEATVLDLNSPGRRVLRRISTRTAELSAGEHRMHLRFIGEPGQIVGVDFLWIQAR